MVIAELLERAVMVTKTVWCKKGDEISRREVKRMVATEVKPRTELKVEEQYGR